MRKRIVLFLAAAALAAGGVAANRAAAHPPEPCPVHPIIGQNTGGIYVWPPGCTGPISTGVDLPPL